jgi:heme oxygenase
MLARLKEETRVHHGEADAARLSPLSVRTSVAGYVSYLARIYGLEAAIEAALELTPELAAVIDPRSWTRAHWIVDDLVALGVEAARATSLPRCAAITLGTIADALGWMYVIERNAALHGVVRRHFARRMPGQIDIAGTYLSTTEALAAQRLRVIGNALDEVARAPGVLEKIVEAAHAAFRMQLRWLRQMPMRALSNRVA